MNSALDTGEKFCFIKKSSLPHWLFTSITAPEFKVRNNSKWQSLQTTTNTRLSISLAGKVEQTKIRVHAENRDQFPVIISAGDMCVGV